MTIRKLYKHGENTLFVAGKEGCDLGREETFKRADMRVIHACRECFKRVKTDDEYAVLDEHGLYLDLVDSRRSMDFNIDLFKVGIRFLEDHLIADPKAGYSVVVHCSKGNSRSAGIVLVFLARQRKLAGQNYEAAHRDMVRLDEGYYPGTGIMNFMSENWRELMTFEWKN